jgi:Flp pilus assembly protein protease CpaA
LHGSRKLIVEIASAALVAHFWRVELALDDAGALLRSRMVENWLILGLILGLYGLALFAGRRWADRRCCPSFGGHDSQSSVVKRRY